MTQGRLGLPREAVTGPARPQQRRAIWWVVS